MKTTISIILMLIGIGLAGGRIYQKIVFKQEVSGYLKRAADANTIDLAKQELGIAVAYLEANNMTEGYTSIFYRTPDEDVGFWYQNLKASLNELENLQSNSALEKTNVLIKLRETLLDSGEKTRVTIPEGLHVFPNNGLWALLGWTALIFFLVGFVMLMAALNQFSKNQKALKNEKN